ncbi:hypothetical protein RT41_GL000793 [Lactococcus fujiensis JCM 16395]|uniref:Uncharacterized protein n=1 Tax=Lactococcus fujiensis JCM 16395 TaxID=1291764 RepID=A0A2A5RNT2_9LACT|nr:hypothetical protein RT41_GL000793 [Lactococcus fujiensis JCM 16395]
MFPVIQVVFSNASLTGYMSILPHFQLSKSYFGMIFILYYVKMGLNKYL